MNGIDHFLKFLSSLPDFLIYLLLGISAYVENIFPPIPGDTITAFGAFLVGINRLDFLLVYIATTLGSLAGFMTLFWLGGFLGRRYFIVKDYRFLKAKDIVKGEEWIRHYGYVLVLFNRFLPGVRSVISVVCGISRLSGLKVALLALISCSVWNLIWIWAGYELGNNWELMRERMTYLLQRYNGAMLLIAVVFIAVLVIKRYLKPGE